MKKRNFKFSYWMVFIAIVMGVSVSSCTKEEAVKPSGNDQVNLKVLEMTNPVPVEPAQYCDLIAGQYINVGQVISWEDAGKLFVQYVTSGDWKLYEAHVYYGLKSEMPLTKKGAPKIGQFTDSYDNLPGLTVVTFSYNIVQPKEDDCVVLATHAVVATNDDMGDEETAWSKCGPPVLTLKTFFTDGTWAVSSGDIRGSMDGDIISYGTPMGGGTSWCQKIGFNTIEPSDNAYWDLLYGAGGFKVGEFVVSGTFPNLVISINAPGKTVNYSHVYIGSVFQSIACPEYWKWPTHPGDNLSVTIAMQNSNVEFDKSWGWYQQFCE